MRGSVLNWCPIGRNAMASSVSNQGTIVIGYYAGDHASADVDNAVIIGRMFTVKFFMLLILCSFPESFESAA